MQLEHASTAVPPHGQQSLVLERQAFPHGFDEIVDTARRDQPTAVAMLDQLGDTGDARGDHGALRCKRFHDHDRQALREARKHEAPAASDRLTDLLCIQPTGDPHPTAESKRADPGLHAMPQIPVADIHDLELPAFGTQPLGCLEQHHWTLLVAHPGDADEAVAQGIHRLRRRRELPVQSATHQMDLRPILLRAPTIQLAAREGAYCADERCVPDLRCQAQELGPVEFLRTMNCEAERDPRDEVCQHRHFGGVRAEVSVNVIAGLGPAGNHARLCEVDEVINPRAISLAHELERSSRRPQEPPRVAEQGSEHRPDNAAYRRPEHIPSFSPFGLVGRVRKRIVPAP